MAWRYLGLADYLLIGEAVLGVLAETLARLDRFGLVESALAAPAAAFAGVEVYPDLETKVAVLLWHLVKNHPLPDGNKRCAFIAAILFAELNGRTCDGLRTTRTRPTGWSAPSPRVRRRSTNSQSGSEPGWATCHRRAQPTRHGKPNCRAVLRRLVA